MWPKAAGFRRVWCDSQDSVGSIAQSSQWGGRREHACTRIQRSSRRNAGTRRHARSPNSDRTTAKWAAAMRHGQAHDAVTHSKALGSHYHSCKLCGRTFNAVTGTPLAGLRRKEVCVSMRRWSPPNPCHAQPGAARRPETRELRTGAVHVVRRLPISFVYGGGRIEVPSRAACGTDLAKAKVSSGSSQRFADSVRL